MLILPTFYVLKVYSNDAGATMQRGEAFAGGQHGFHSQLLRLQNTLLLVVFSFTSHLLFFILTWHHSTGAKKNTLICTHGVLGFSHRHAFHKFRVLREHSKYF